MMKIEELLERIEPFDELQPKSKFIQILNDFPKFKEELGEGNFT